MRLADYVMQTLVAAGVTDAFLVTGGGAMHLNDAIGRTPGLRWTAFHHEQSCAVAAESYFRLTHKLALVNVTAGPGGTNAITGVFGAYVESCAMVVVSGQVKRETLVQSTGLPLRQLGDQEIDIVRMVAPITKYAVMVTDPLTIRYHLERALHLATAGRPGPVWLDIPIDVQSSQIDPQALKSYDSLEDAGEPAAANNHLQHQVAKILEKLAAAKRPVIYAGSGIRLGRAEKEFRELADRLGVPVVTGFNAHDLLPASHRTLCGRPGTIGDRAGNFAVQNADFVLVLGCRLTIRQVSYNWASFARAAYKVVVDIDPSELEKPTIAPDLKVCADAKAFLSSMLSASLPPASDAHQDYLAWCQERVRRYPVVLPEYWNGTEGINPYCFVDALFEALPENEIVVTGDGTACVATFQAAKIKEGQRLYSNGGCASMGWDLPAALGAAIAANKRVICLAGDGSLQMNIQELITASARKLPIKLFVLNNDGYLSIKQTQNNFFPGNEIGCSPVSGVHFPDYQLLAGANRLPYKRLDSHATLKAGLQEILANDDALLCEVKLDLRQAFSPKLSSRRLPDGRMVTSPLEDMAPFLSREELASNMLIPSPAE